jgi:hypothetical protein
VAVAHDEDQLAEARTAVRGLLGFYASTPAYRRVLDAHGWGALQEELRALTRAGRWAELPSAVPDKLLDAVALVGTAEDVAAGLRARFGRCARVALSTPYPVATADLAALAALLA